MSMITELFGQQVLTMTLAEVKKLINDLPPAQKERRSYLLHDWAAITGHPMTEQDFIDVNGLPDEE